MKTYKIKTTEIDYCVEYEDIYDILDERFGENNYDESDIDLVIEEVKKDLPQELDLEVTCKPEHLDEYLLEVIAQETGWFINDFEYKVISERRFEE